MSTGVPMKKSLRLLYIVLGFLSVGIGFIGVILLVLPTTPFLLVASFFFSKGSERFSAWFFQTKLYKSHLEEFVQNRAMTLRAKVSLCAFASSVLLLSAYLVNNVYARLFVSLVVIYKYYYFVFKIRTIKPKVSGEGRLANANAEHI